MSSSFGGSPPKASGLFPPPPAGTIPNSRAASRSPSPEARPVSPKPKSGGSKPGLFSCLRADHHNNNDDDDRSSEDRPDDGDLNDDELDGAQWSDATGAGIRTINCPRIDDFIGKLTPCKTKQGGVSMDLLFGSLELYQNFETFLNEERAIENLQCWLALRNALAVFEPSHASYSADADALLANVRPLVEDLNARFFDPNSASHVGCCEMYEEMKNLNSLAAASAPIDQIQNSLHILKKTLELASLRDPLYRWQIFHGAGDEI